MTDQTVIVLDFGGQYRELIARRVRECGVHSLIMRGDTPPDELKKRAPIGIIMTGGPASVYAAGSPSCDKAVFELGIPVLGICYGAQLMAHLLGGTVKSCKVSEYGKTKVTLTAASPLFEGLEEQQVALMSHTDYIALPPDGFVVSAHTADCPTAAMENIGRRLFGLQFHPEVAHTENGTAMIRNFLFSVCGAKGDYTMDDYIVRQVEQIRKTVGKEKVLLALSGGVDSSVCAALLEKALPGQLTCIFVDHGFMRKDEGDQVEAAFKDKNLNFVRVNAAERFLAAIAGMTEPERKRKAIGAEFVKVFEEQAARFGDIKLLAQGTIYPDVIESGANNSATIKSHHNVGGLPKDMRFTGIVEPLSGLFKDEVRVVGRKLGLPGEIVERQPFPGPGLAIRIIGEVTERRLEILREADAIMRREIARSYAKADQYFAVLTDLRSVGVMGDERTYDYTLALRAVTTGDFMTAEYARLPHSLLSRISTLITNQVRGINRVVYDITAKPPATIEWE